MCYNTHSLIINSGAGSTMADSDPCDESWGRRAVT